MSEATSEVGVGTESSAARESCAECASATISRRSLLRGLVLGAGASAVASALSPLAPRMAVAATPGYVGDTLVVVSLRGGFDGLSAVVPVTDPDYHLLRPTVGIPAPSTTPIDARFGLHPALAGLSPLMSAGKVAFVHAVGLPTPDRSHFSATDTLEQAGTGERTGWLDRLLRLHSATGTYDGVQLGGATSYAMAGPFPDLGMDSLDSFTLHAAWDAESSARWRAALTGLHSRAGAPLRTSTSSTLRTLSSAAALAAPANAPGAGVVYPAGPLAQALADAARIIRGNVGARVIAIDVDDWDMHAGMGTVGTGWMRDQLTSLGSSLATFAADLGPLLDNVTLLTLTEFGRRAQENQSAGLDHGWGSAMILLGGGLVSGVHGTWPGLSQGALVGGDLAVTTDYRAVLADVLAARCGSSLGDLASVFPGFTGPRLTVTRPR